MKRIRTRYLYLAEAILFVAAFLLAWLGCSGWGAICLVVYIFLTCVTGWRKEKKRIKDGYYNNVKPWP